MNNCNTKLLSRTPMEIENLYRAKRYVVKLLIVMMMNCIL